MTLTTDTLHNIPVVRDSEGGTWWPSDGALAEIRASDDPEDTVLAICEREPMRGTWEQ